MKQISGLDVRSASREAASKLLDAGIPESEASAEILLSELIDIRRGEIPFHREPLTDGQRDAYETMISRRLNREPVQRIIGYAYFRNLTLELSPETLIPRPDTESVVDVALNLIDARQEAPTVLDLGTGTGAIAISIAGERPACKVHASDISEAALETAGRNAKRNAKSNGADVTFHHADLADGLDSLKGEIDILISNPPYIERETLNVLAPEVRNHDPHLALDGGTDGLDLYRRIFTETRHLLAPNAEIVLEVGDGQAEDVPRLGENAGLTLTGTHEDLAGSVRAVTLKRRDGRR